MEKCKKVTIQRPRQNEKDPKNDHVNDQVNILQLTSNQLAILNLIKQSDQTNDQVNTLSISQKLKLSYSTVKRAIYVLQQNNFIKRIGSDKTGYWSVLK
jgi:DNA-binding MarR family transcriptional regulator